MKTGFFRQLMDLKNERKNPGGAARVSVYSPPQISCNQECKYCLAIYILKYLKAKKEL
jgi:hypothetical protein